MSRPNVQSSQSPSVGSPAPSHIQDSNTNGMTASNTAQNASINDPKLQTSSAKKSSVGGMRNPEDEITPEQAEEEALPEQKHAGAVGYGPDFANKNRTTMGDKIAGLKEELVGKITKNPELVQKGHDRKTGELKKREHEDESDPFATEEKKEAQTSPASNAQEPSAGTPSEPSTRTNTANGNTKGDSGLDGAKPGDVDLTAGKARLTAESSHPAAEDEGVQRAAEI
ncbi:hypothetical protein K439DRAFT_1638425 [Ramaria rubella]|nr:hypothetical protein K439DRAFT_1638425 [Ramaria rubella]